MKLPDGLAGAPLHARCGACANTHASVDEPTQPPDGPAALACVNCGATYAPQPGETARFRCPQCTPTQHQTPAPAPEPLRAPQGTLLAHGRAAPSPLEDLGAVDKTQPFASAPVAPVERRLLRYADGLVMDTAGTLVASDALEGRTPLSIPYGSKRVVRRLPAYDVLEELGHGGMGAVHLGYSLNLRRFVAIKLILDTQASSALMLLRFHNEVVLAARLQHPNVVSVFDSGEHQGLHYFVMEVVRGGSLLAHIKKSAGTVNTALVGVMAKTARAVDYAHRRGVIHRDIKPDNILLDEALEPRVTDFGIAKSMERASDLTGAGVALGTAAYMPPEQANGELDHIGPLSDVYALGATLYHVLCGRPPFVGPDFMSVVYQVINKDVTPPSQLPGGPGVAVPVDLETICLKALEKDASKRYPSAAALAEDLERFLAGDAISARPATPLERIQRKVQRNRVALVATALTGVVMTGLVGVLGALTVGMVERTSASLVDGDVQAALQEAAVLEHSIRVNMLEGRADQVRRLMRQINDSGAAGEVQVVRADRQQAYRDTTTRQKVAQRLARPEVMAAIAQQHPQVLPAIDMLQRFAFPNIDRNVSTGALVDVDLHAWTSVLTTRKPAHYERVRAAMPELVVLYPLENSAECRVCHDDSDDAYARQPVRAVVMLTRSQWATQQTIQENRNVALSVGAVTALAFLLLILLFYKVLGFRPRSRRFGVGQPT